MDRYTPRFRTNKRAVALLRTGRNNGLPIFATGNFGKLPPHYQGFSAVEASKGNPEDLHRDARILVTAALGQAFPMWN